MPTVPEVAFLGRSNVGKSSVINSLLGEKMAKTSSVPGRTRSINFFQVRRPGKPTAELAFADLPGYGYAKVSKEVSAEWPKFIEPYLEHRPTLVLCIVLIDTNIAPQPSDAELLAWLRMKQRRFVAVGTKSDRVSGNVLSNSLRTLKQELQVERILPFSTKTGEGKAELWREILSAAGLG